MRWRRIGAFKLEKKGKGGGGGEIKVEGRRALKYGEESFIK